MTQPLPAGRLAITNREIRDELRAADERRRNRDRVQRSLHYLDQLIRAMEEFNLRGMTILPDSFWPGLLAVGDALPSGIQPPRRWHHEIAHAIDQCFDLQEQVLRRYLRPRLTQAYGSG